MNVCWVLFSFGVIDHEEWIRDRRHAYYPGLRLYRIHSMLEATLAIAMHY